jgi:hypothetical protein
MGFVIFTVTYCLLVLHSFSEEGLGLAASAPLFGFPILFCPAAAHKGDG